MSKNKLIPKGTYVKIEGFDFLRSFNVTEGMVIGTLDNTDSLTYLVSIKVQGKELSVGIEQKYLTPLAEAIVPEYKIADVLTEEEVKAAWMSALEIMQRRCEDNVYQNPINYSTYSLDSSYSQASKSAIYDLRRKIQIQLHELLKNDLEVAYGFHKKPEMHEFFLKLFYFANEKSEGNPAGTIEWFDQLVELFAGYDVKPLPLSF